MQLTLQPTLKQHLAYQALQDPSKDIVFLGGGAGGGKSWLICESRLLNAIRFPGYRSFIAREELKRLMQSTYITFTKVCSFHKIPEKSWRLNGQYNFIEFTNGSRIDLIDLKYLPADPLYERLGSLEYTDGAIEEAGEVDFVAFDVIKSRVGRHMNKELNLHPTLLITGNPKDNWTKRLFYKPWKNHSLPANVAFIQSLYRDNPYTSDAYGKQLATISNEATKARLMDGNWEYDADPATLINFDAIVDMWTNSLPLTPKNREKFLTGDIARYGSDKTALFVWEGMTLLKAYVYQKQGTDVTEGKARTALSDHHVPYSQGIIDEDGVGGGVVDHLPGIKGFMANSKPTLNPATGLQENFENLKTQCAYKLAEAINTHQMAISPEFILETNVPGLTPEVFKENLIQELRQVKTKDADKDGKLKIMHKEDIKTNIGRSPDLLDNFIMRMFFELTNYGEVESAQNFEMYTTQYN